MFTPQAMLSAPRRSAGVPDLSGARVLHTVSTYSFEEHKKTTELRCLETESLESHLLTNEEGVSEPQWLEGQENAFICLKAGDKSTTQVIIGSVKAEWKDKNVVSSIDGPIGNLKIATLSATEYALVFSGQASSDGTLYNPDKAPKPHSSARLYKSLFVRDWDHWVPKERTVLWYSLLKKTDDKWTLSKPVNALKGTKLESPYGAFGGTDHFDVSKR